MKVEIAQKAGACFGVNRSLEILKECVDKYNCVVTLGELIHNPKTVSELKSKYGVVSVTDLEQAVKLNADCVVVRSHGVPVEVLQHAYDIGLNLVDATCPHVKHVQKTAATLAKKYESVVVIGKADHPEVSGVCSYIRKFGAEPICLYSEEDLKQNLSKLKKFHTIGVVSQTTQAIETFNLLVQKMLNYGFSLDVKRTICSATSKRQECAKELAKRVDGFVVVGGKNSSNTRHLAEIVKNFCNLVFHIESNEEIIIDDLVSCKTIGLSAGASTPQNQIDSTYKFLVNIGKNTSH